MAADAEPQAPANAVQRKIGSGKVHIPYSGVAAGGGGWLIAYPHRLKFWCSCDVVSPHKQGSFDFSRARLAFFRDLPD